MRRLIGMIGLLFLAACATQPAFCFEMKTVIEHEIYRSDQPMVAGDFAKVATSGITLVVDLENEAGEAKWELKKWETYADGVTFYTMPMSAFYIPMDEYIDKLAAIIDNATVTGQVVLIHCKHGEDRTGLISALILRARKKISKREGWKYMLDNGFHPLLLGLSWYYWFGA